VADVDGIVIYDKHNKIWRRFRFANHRRNFPTSFRRLGSVAAQKFPYNRSAYYKNELTAIETVYPGNTATRTEKRAPVELMYTVGYTTSGKVEQQEMDAKLDGFVHNMKVYEGGGRDVKSNRTASVK
jgi:hypothetical protein